MDSKRKKIKVAIVINDFLVGGAQKLIADQLKYFDYDRFDVYLITLFEFPEKKDFYYLVPNNIRTYRLNFNSLWDFIKWQKLAKVLHNNRTDMVVSHLFDANFVTRILAIFLRIRVIIVEHNTYSNKKKWQIFADRFLAFFTKKIIAVSNTVRDFTIQQERISSDKFTVIPNGIDIEAINQFKSEYSKSVLRKQYEFEEKEIIFLSVGRLTDQKNHALLINGFGSFLQQGIRAKLLILGEGYLEGKLKEQICSLGFQDSIILLGTKENVFNYYRMSDFLISTSLIEGLSIAYLEALGFGLPLIVTKTAGTDQLIEHAENGFFVSVFSPEEVKKTIQNAFEADYAMLSQSAYGSATKYDIRTSVKRYEDICTTSV